MFEYIICLHIQVIQCKSVSSRELMKRAPKLQQLYLCQATKIRINKCTINSLAYNA